GAFKELASLRENALLLVAPQVGHRLIGVVEQNAAAPACRDLVTPDREGRTKLGELTCAHQLQRREHMDRADVRRDVALRADVLETSHQAGASPLIVEGDRRACERAHATRVPEVPARE